MRKVVVAIFAHPDDESFGPGGTLALLAETNDVYIITVTDGEAGLSSLNGHKDSLDLIRKQELFESARILGIKEVFFLGYNDGCLSNSIYLKVADELENKLEELQPETVITFEPRGVSGHLDHIAVSYITTYVVRKLPSIKNLHYFCISSEESGPLEKDYFVYFPKGYDRDKIDLVINTESMWETKIKAMRAHKSQAHDAEKFIAILEKLPKEEHFLVYKKD